MRAAIYFRRAAELGHAAAQNALGECLEFGRGVKVNLESAALWYFRAAAQAHADAENNYGFCLEYGRGVAADLTPAEAFYIRAAGHGHSEAPANVRRCRRLQTPPRLDPFASAPVARSPPKLQAHLPEFHENEIAEPEMINLAGCTHGHVIARDAARVVRLFGAPERGWQAVAVEWCATAKPTFWHEAFALQRLQHSLIVGIHNVEQSTRRAILEYVPNGSVQENFELLHGETRIARIITAIALAMAFVHDQCIIHRNLTPASIFLDERCRVRIGKFGCSEEKGIIPAKCGPSMYYRAPESWQCRPCAESDDVFAFGLLMYEILTHARVPHEVAETQRGFKWRNGRPQIPEEMRADVAVLIQRCWAQDPGKRPPFTEILQELQRIGEKTTHGVRSEKVRRFGDAVEEWEAKKRTRDALMRRPMQLDDSDGSAFGQRHNH
jgi:serine/threonine protein kinase